MFVFSHNKLKAMKKIDAYEEYDRESLVGGKWYILLETDHFGADILKFSKFIRVVSVINSWVPRYRN